MPSSAVFESFADLNIADFNDASFTIGAFAAGVFSGGGGKLTDTAGSIMEFNLKSGMELTAIVSEDFKAGFNAQDAKPEAEVTLVDVSMGHGGITTNDAPAGVDPPPDSSESMAKPTPKEAKAWAPVLFDWDSATLLDRPYFERRLALNRAVFEVE